MRALPYASNPETSRTLVERDRDVLVDALHFFEHDPSGIFEFQAQLPEVIGQVPKSEQAAFDHLDPALLASGTVWEAMPSEFAKTCQQINDDMYSLDPHYAERRCKISFFKSGDQGIKLHIDRGIYMSSQATDIFYLIANRNAITAHSGNGRLHLAPHIGGLTITLHEDFDSTTSATAADFEIIRCTRLTAHQSRPPYTENPRQRNLLQSVFLS